MQQSSRIHSLDELAIVCKVIHLVDTRPGILNDPIAFTAVTIIIKIVFVTANVHPCIPEIRRAIIVSRTTSQCLPRIRNHSAGLIEGIGDFTPIMGANGRTEILFPEMMPPLFIDQLPAGTQLAIDSIAVCIYACIQEQSAVFYHSDVDAVLTKVVIVAIHQSDTGLSDTCDIVSVARSLGNQAILHSAISIEFILALAQ